MSFIHLSQCKTQTPCHKMSNLPPSYTKLTVGYVAMHNPSLSWAPVQTHGLSLPSSLGPELSRFWVYRTSVSHLPPSLLSQTIMSFLSLIFPLLSLVVWRIIGEWGFCYFFFFPSFCHRPLWLVLFPCGVICTSQSDRSLVARRWCFHGGKMLALEVTRNLTLMHAYQCLTNVHTST